MASALDTFCGQSYGAKKYHMLGIHMQGAMFVLVLVSIPLAIIWANTGAVLLALGQDADISEAAGTYTPCMIPALFAYGIVQCLFRFLQTQNIVFPLVLCSGITTSLRCLLDSGIQIRAWVSRSCLCKFNLLLDQFVVVGIIYETLPFLHKNLDRLFKGGVAQYPHFS